MTTSPPQSRTYAVSGMTCSHCVRSVSEEVGAVPGVADVSVDLGTGIMKVTGEGFDDSAINAAVVEAGYEIEA